MMRHTAFGVNLVELYRQTTEPFIGIFLLWRPALLFRDAALTKRILGPDFVHFHDRSVYSRPAEPISDSVFANLLRVLRPKACGSSILIRFSANDSTSAASSDAFIPFGDGPRMCLGIRLGKLSAKVVIVKLMHYNFEPVSDAELEFDNFGVTLQVKGGIPMRLTERVRS